MQVLQLASRRAFYVPGMTVKGQDQEASSWRPVKNLNSLVPIKRSYGWPVKDLNRRSQKEEDKMPSFNNTAATTLTDQTQNEPAEDEVLQGGTNTQGQVENGQDGQNGAPGAAPEAQHYTLDEILKSDPAIKAEYDRKMQAAIAKHDARSSVRNSGNGIQQNAGNAEAEEQETEEIDIDELIDARVNERITEERFGTYLDNLLDQAGIVDKQGYLSHIDIEDLYEHYDPETNSIPGYEELEAEMREEYPFYFGSEAGGMEHGTFGSNAPTTLRGALGEKYGVK